MKKIAIWLSILVILMPFVPYMPIETVEAADSNMQTLSQPVVSTSVNAKPYVAYWQLDNGSFRVGNSYVGEKAVASSGGFPVETVMAERLYMDNYPADQYYIEGFKTTTYLGLKTYSTYGLHTYMTYYHGWELDEQGEQKLWYMVPYSINDSGRFGLDFKVNGKRYHWHSE